MALTIGQKHARFIQFVRGLHHRLVAERLGAYGLRQEDYEEALGLLRNSIGPKLLVPPYHAPDPSVFERLDAWENKWYPIIEASLKRQHPEIHETVFLNLAQAEGNAVLVSVDTLVTRLRELQQDGGAEAQAAIELLQRRGVTEEVLHEAEVQLKKLETKPEPLAPIRTPEERAAAENAMWAWYLEWSTIARQAIRDRSLLRLLGFLQRSPSEEEEDTETSEGSEEPSPQPSLQPQPQPQPEASP